jgi:hypothetical protein
VSGSQPWRPPASPDAGFPDASLLDATADSHALGDVGVMLADAGPDTAIPDAPPDVVVDAADAAPGCSPMPITAFAPGALAATNNPYQGQCYNGEWTTVVDDCVADGSTIETCSGFVGDAATACINCLVTPQSNDAGYGPIIDGIVYAPNVAGCIAVSDTSNAGQACALAVQNAAACAQYACQTRCPVTDDTSRSAFLACTSAAATGVCATYTAAAASCVSSETDASFEVAQNCFNGATPDDQYSNLAFYFCGS